MSMQHEPPFGSPVAGGFRPAGPLAQPVGMPNAVDGRTQATAAKSKRGKTAKAGKAKGAKMSKRAFGILGTLMALVAFVGVLAVLGGGKTTTTYVVRAKETLRAQEPVVAAALEAVPVQPGQLEPGVISAPTAAEALAYADGSKAFIGADGQADPKHVIVGRYPVIPVLAGQQVRLEVFESQITPMLGALQPDERLISLAVPFAYGVAGQLQPGNRVDVYAIDSHTSTAVLLRADVEIVSFQADTAAVAAAAQQQSTDAGRTQTAQQLLPTNPIPGVYVLRIPTQDASKFSVATQASIMFVYRPVDAGTTAPESISLTTLFGTAAKDQAALDALKVIQTYADYSGSPMPGVEMYRAAGVNGVNAENIVAANTAVAAKTSADIATLAQLQALLDADQNVGTNKAPATPTYVEPAKDVSGVVVSGTPGAVTASTVAAAGAGG